MSDRKGRAAEVEAYRGAAAMLEERLKEWATSGHTPTAEELRQVAHVAGLANQEVRTWVACAVAGETYALGPFKLFLVEMRAKPGSEAMNLLGQVTQLESMMQGARGAIFTAGAEARATLDGQHTPGKVTRFERPKKG